jgi:hypothetical protein
MRRWLFLGVAVAMAAVALWTWWPERAIAYASLRQSTQERVPGTLDVYLEPPPAGFAPVLSPAAAYRERAAAHDRHPVSMTLAVVRQGFAENGSLRRAAPSWVVISRDVCYFANKGDLISPSRASDGKSDGCTPKNLFFQVLDARTGTQLFTIAGFDPSGRWAPARGGSPAE